LLQWLFEAKKRYGLSILNYAVTSNHIHLVVVDVGDRDTIPRSIQLVAGRIGQEYNQRKARKGAFWEDRYHATAIEKGDHLYRCLVYVDLNMVRAGVVAHPSQWPFSGYNEIQEPKRKNALIDYERLRTLLGLESYELVKSYYEGWIEEYLGNGKNMRDDTWTKSIAVGSRGFVEGVKAKLGILARGRQSVGRNGVYQLREPSVLYGGHFGAENDDIGLENTYFWNINHINSI